MTGANRIRVPSSGVNDSTRRAKLRLLYQMMKVVLKHSPGRFSYVSRLDRDPLRTATSAGSPSCAVRNDQRHSGFLQRLSAPGRLAFLCSATLMDLRTVGPIFSPNSGTRTVAPVIDDIGRENLVAQDLFIFALDNRGERSDRLQGYGHLGCGSPCARGWVQSVVGWAGRLADPRRLGQTAIACSVLPWNGPQACDEMSFSYMGERDVLVGKCRFMAIRRRRSGAGRVMGRSERAPPCRRAHR